METMSKKLSRETLGRHEFKYRLNVVQALAVRDYIESIGIMRDRHDPKNGYIVTSLYFDSFGLDDFYDKLGGFFSRKKIRARIYGHDLSDGVSEVYLEIKYKNDMFIKKERVVIPVDKWHAFLNGETNELFPMFSNYILGEGRVPQVVVRYRREAFVEHFFSRTRLTIDSDIEVLHPAGFDESDFMAYDVTAASSGGSILEIKFSNVLPWWFNFMVKKFNLQRDEFSKYAHGMEKQHKYNPLPR